MGTVLIFSGFKPSFGASLKEIVIKNMMIYANSFWVSLLSYIVQVFGFIFRSFLSYSGKNSAEIGSDFDGVCQKPDEVILKNDDGLVGFDQIKEKDMHKLDSEVGSVSSANTSKYQFFYGDSLCAFLEEPQTMSFTVQEMFVISNDLSSHKQEFHEDHSVSEKDFLGFGDHSSDVSFSDDLVPDNSSSSEHDDCGELSKEVVVKQGKTENSVCLEQEPLSFVEHEFHVKEELPKLEEEVVVKQGKTESSVCLEQEPLSFVEHEFSVKGEIENVEEEVLSAEVVVSQGKTESLVCEEQEALSLSEHESNVEGDVVVVEEENLSEHEVVDQVRSSISNSDDFWATIHKCDDFFGSNRYSDFDSDEILCDKSPGEAPETPLGVGDQRVDYNEDSSRSSDDFQLDQNSLKLGGDDVESEHEDTDPQFNKLEQFIELEPQSLKSPAHSEEHIPSDESDSEDEFDQEGATFDGLKGIDALESCDEEDDQTGLDVLLEQKELIRQMKREMRNLKINGLPTILEESESPRVEDDLRPLKIDERIEHKDRMDEIQTLYKRYLDKMRKLDILSQQTMYAIGLLQLKSQDQFASSKKVSVPVIKSLLAQNLWSYKLRKHDADPVQKLIRDLQKDLELVYVGQLCLSWEMLKWQHHKSKELQAYDPDGFRHHNQVAGEFQKFQVLLQRFTEEEPFHHGPRVQHFVKSRCSLVNLLQAPLIKEDPRGEWRGKGEGEISIGMLKEVIGASMHAFWEFLRADKDEFHALTLMGIHSVHVDLQTPSDTELLAEIRSNLQKKEKRLKDLVKSGNCIVKKFQKHHNHQLSHEMFLAQVELRLVSRVLNMSKLTTDQLLWCHKKMSKINIVGRKVYVDSSFLLFPC